MEGVSGPEEEAVAAETDSVAAAAPSAPPAPPPQMGFTVPSDETSGTLPGSPEFLEENLPGPA